MSNPSIERGVALIQQAVQKDNAKQWDDALRLYTDGISHLMAGLKNETNPRMICTIREKVATYMDRAEEIKRFREQATKTPLPRRSSVPGSAQLKQLLVLPRTQVLQINGDQKSVIGVGDLQVLFLENDQSLLLMIPGVFQYATQSRLPSLKASHGSYVFPAAGKCYGIVLASTIPRGDLNMFEGLLTQYSQFKVANYADDAKERPPQDQLAQTGETAAVYIAKGTQLAQTGIRAGTAMAARGIVTGREYLKSKTAEVEEAPEVSETTKVRIERAKMMTHAAVKVSGAVLTGAKAACSEISSALGDAVRRSSFGQKIASADSERAQAGKKVAVATLSGAFVIFRELEEAALTLVSEVADSSANVARHRYGDQVGDAADGVSGIVTDSSHVARNVFDMGLKGPLGATVVKDVAIDAVSTPTELEANRDRRQQQHHMDPAVRAMGLSAVKAMVDAPDAKPPRPSNV